MGWIRSVVLDIACTAIIAVFVFVSPPQEWAKWVVYIYTPLMLFLKIVAVATKPNAVKRAGKLKRPEAPTMVYHILYAANVLLLLWARHFWLAAAWAMIWILSVAYVRRARPSA